MGRHGTTPHVKTTEWEFLRDIGIALGVPSEAILKEEKAANTFENARFSLEVLHHLGVQR
ncbi:YdcF family protein [Paenibacillus xanthanilyticus]|uniref:YdcF family protein n=1 Tax=Paenibacillus xanthanilyticus TaxID=1783531 RepID=A0ABV8JWW0_9BACL